MLDQIFALISTFLGDLTYIVPIAILLVLLFKRR